MPKQAPPSILVIVLRVLGTALVAHALFRSYVSPYAWVPNGSTYLDNLVASFVFSPTYEFIAGAAIAGLAEWVKKMKDQMHQDIENARATGTDIVLPASTERELERMRQEDLKRWHRDREDPSR